VEINDRGTIMRPRFIGIILCVMAIGARAESPWDGLWYLDKAKSRFAEHHVALERLPNGMWQYTVGPRWQCLPSTAGHIPKRMHQISR
jgi:hypothetical protein